MHCAADVASLSGMPMGCSILMSERHMHGAMLPSSWAQLRPVQHWASMIQARLSGKLPPPRQLLLAYHNKIWSDACSGSGGGTARSTLKVIQKGPGELPSPDAKPEYFAVPGTVTFINPEQTMYYMAAPENNRKVTLSLIY